MPSGTIWLLPTTLSGGTIDRVIPAYVLGKIRNLRCFFAEEPKTARAFLKEAGHQGPITELRIVKLTNDSSAADIGEMIRLVQAGEDAGILSESGCPAIADPGAPLVRMAHRSGIRVTPMVGPSSIILGLMASGLETQRFSFNGYLPIKPFERDRTIAVIEAKSMKNRSTEIFIETPYRNQALLNALVANCRPETMLSIARDLTLETEEICTKNIAEWKRDAMSLHKRPCVFMLLAQPGLKQGA